MKAAASFGSAVLVFAVVVSAGAAFAAGLERPLTLDEAIALALEKNEGIDVERASLATADASVSGAKGAYDPLLELGANFRRAQEPVNSAFSGAPAGESAPTTRALDGQARCLIENAATQVRQLVCDCGRRRQQRDDENDRTHEVSPSKRYALSIDRAFDVLLHRHQIERCAVATVGLHFPQNLPHHAHGDLVSALSVSCAVHARVPCRC